MSPWSLTILGVVVLSSSVNASEECLAGPVPVSGDETVYGYNSTLAHFSPKTNLSALRFVWFEEGRLYVELNQDARMLYEDFKLAFPDFDEDELPGIFKSFLSPSQQCFVFANIVEAPGDRFCVFFPHSLRCESLTLSAVTLCPTFEGGFWGFMGILDGDFKELPERWPVALAFKSTRKCKAKRLGDETVDESGRTRIAQYLQNLLAEVDLRSIRPRHVATLLGKVEERKLEIVDARHIFLAYPDVRGVVTQVRIEDMHYLFCLLDEGDTFRVIPFPKDFEYSHRAPKGSIVIHDADGETDVSVRHGEMLILPDLDGNGGNELLLRAPISALFGIVRDDFSSWQPRYVIEIVRTF